MMQLLVDNSFWELFPGARIGIVLASGFDNTARPHEAAALLDDAVAASAAALAGADIATHPAVAPWRAAYARFGAKPSKFRSSIESLLRAAQAGRLRSINPLVDLYNTVSLRHQLPCGGEDRAALAGDVHLTRARGDEPFRTIGADADEPPAAGEVIYADALGAICRCWNWREADRTKLTPQTRDALLVIEALPAHDPAQLDRALDELAALVTEHLGGRTSQAVLTRDAPAVGLSEA
jgi:DNA/RNA-binding domain of Phe-tRNA-synthetase-like protein